MTDFGNERGDISRDLLSIKYIIKEYYEYHASKFSNLGKLWFGML